LVSFKCNDEKEAILLQVRKIKEDMKDLPIINSFESATPGVMSFGVVASVQKFGCIIQFDNQICAIAPTKELT
jgi:ribosomal protein S1